NERSSRPSFSRSILRTTEEADVAERGLSAGPRSVRLTVEREVPNLVAVLDARRPGSQGCELLPRQREDDRAGIAVRKAARSSNLAGADAQSGQVVLSGKGGSVARNFELVARISVERCG